MNDYHSGNFNMLSFYLLPSVHKLSAMKLILKSTVLSIDPVSIVAISRCHMTHFCGFAFARLEIAKRAKIKCKKILQLHLLATFKTVARRQKTNSPKLFNRL